MLEGLVRGLRQLDAAGLAAAAGLDLRLDHAEAELLGGGAGLLGRGDHDAEGGGDAVLGEQFLCLVLHQVHVPHPSRVGRRGTRRPRIRLRLATSAVVRTFRGMNAIDVPEMLPDPPGVKVQYFTATTLDGFIADADNSLDWLFVVERDEHDRSWDEFIDGVGALVMGSTTYEWVLGHHPEMLQGPDRWREFYDDRPTWVFTHRELPRIPSIDLTFVEGEVRDVYDRIVEVVPEEEHLGRRRRRPRRPVRRRRTPRRDPARRHARHSGRGSPAAPPPDHLRADAPAQRRAQRSDGEPGLRRQPAGLSAVRPERRTPLRPSR